MFFVVKVRIVCLYGKIRLRFVWFLGDFRLRFVGKCVIILVTNKKKGVFRYDF